MSEVSLKIPQIGEGLQEARLVAFLKQPGDHVKRDEAIYQMETDKAVMDVESPHEGTVVRWLAQPDDVLEIGADVMVMEVAGEASQEPTSGEVTVFVPQIGEGLQEARIVAFLKQPGDTVARDEAIYQMETDKAVMDVESPYAGTVLRWLAEPDQVLAIGAPVGVLASTDAPAASPSHGPATPAASASTPAASTGGKRRDVPPRTRAYAKEKRLTDAQLDEIPAAGGKLMPADIDAFLSSAPAPAPAASGKGFTESPLPAKQKVLSSRLVRGNQLVVPGMMSVAVDWTAIEAARARVKGEGGHFQPSLFTMFAYAVAKATAKHPIVRSTLVGDGNVRTYHHINLGIAVALPGDELVVAVVRDADTLDWPTFAATARDRIHEARHGKDQADESVTLSITNMAGHGIRDAMAVVVPPGVATIFLGEAHWGVSNDHDAPRFQRQSNVGITIDHRLINGVGGAEVLNSIKSLVEGIDTLLQP